MKKIFKIYPAIIVLSLFFLMTHKVFASAYEQPLQNGEFYMNGLRMTFSDGVTPVDIYGIDYSQVGAFLKPAVSGIQGASSTTNVTSITLSVAQQPGSTGTVSISYACENGGTTYFTTSDNSLDVTTLSTSHFSDFTWTFTPSHPCDISTTDTFYIYDWNGVSSQGLRIAGRNNSSDLGIGIEPTILDASKYRGDYQFSMSINGSFSTNYINFDTNFASTTLTSDFTNWQLRITTPSTTPGLEFGVNYKLSSSTPWQYNDDFKLGHSPAQDLSSDIFPLVKGTNLDSGKEYLAQAFLASNVGSVQTLLAYSPIIVIGVSTGTPILSPGNVSVYPSNPWNSDWCTPSSFVVATADIGQGLCQVFSFLFVPNVSYFQNSINSAQAIFKTHIPFVFYYQTVDTFSNYSASGTATTLLNFRMKIDAANIDIEEHWFDTSDPHFIAVWAFPKSIMQYVLWLILVTYFVGRAVSLFKTESL